MAYSTNEDMLIGDLQMDTDIKTKHVEAASAEIDAKIGHIYAVPLSGLSGYAEGLVKHIANMIATGRAIMAVASGSEDGEVNAYGDSLLREGLGLLQGIISGATVLSGVTQVSEAPALGGAKIFQKDSTSPMDVFYGNVMGGKNDYWLPD
jgi:phage gp36-like protein